MTVFLVLILAVNFLGTRVFGEMEFWFSSLKVIAIIGLIILGIILMAGGGPNHDPIGFRYWRNPGNLILVLASTYLIVQVLSTRYPSKAVTPLSLARLVNSLRGLHVSSRQPSLSLELRSLPLPSEKRRTPERQFPRPSSESFSDWSYSTFLVSLSSVFLSATTTLDF